MEKARVVTNIYGDIEKRDKQFLSFYNDRVVAMEYDADVEVATVHLDTGTSLSIAMKSNVYEQALKGILGSELDDYGKKLLQGEKGQE